VLPQFAPPDDHGFLWIDRDGFAKAFAADVDPLKPRQWLRCKNH